MTQLRVETTPIPGLLVVHMPVHGDARGWFKENWQRAKMVALGLPDFEPVQNNMSYNAAKGATRGIHAEPWDKFVSVATGRVFGAWVDLRDQESFGTTFHLEIGPDSAVYVPRGVGNSYQALADDTSYSYLVNDHWSAGVTYPALNLADETAAIPWPIPLADAEVSEKDRANPALADVAPMQPRKTLILGANGQVGRALAAEFPAAVTATRADLDVTDAEAVAAWPWHEYGTILNAAAYTAVDGAETPEGRVAAWEANAAAPAALARVAREHRLTLVHISSDYVFDGSADVAGPSGYREDAAFAPLGVYGQSKAAGDLAVSTTPRHYILRTSWVIGDGNNFVRTMARLASAGVAPSVVEDQVGRLTFTTTIAEAARHLLTSGAPYGTYNVTNAGEPTSWHAVAHEVYALTGHDPSVVMPTTTEAYFATQTEAGTRISPRPLHSVLDLTKLRATGYEPADARKALRDYLD